MLEDIKPAGKVGGKTNAASLSPDAQELLTNIRHVISAAKNIQQNLLAREKAFEKRLAKAEGFVDTSIKEIHTHISHFNDLLEEMQVQNCNSVIENIRNSDQQKTEGLHELYATAQKSIFEMCKRLEHNANQMVKGIGKTLNTLHADDIQQLAGDCAKQVDTVSRQAVAQMTETMRWFHWKNIAAVFFISIVVSLTIGLYINNEWPWEMHQTVVKQRAAGQAVLTNWTQLSSLDKQIIENDDNVA